MISRRSFMTAAAGLVLPLPVLAQVPATSLSIKTRTLEVKGKAAKVFGIMGSEDDPGIEMIFGEDFNVNLINQLSEDTAIHWHGLAPPVEMDGVPMLAGPVLQAGTTRSYRFQNRKAGTHWMHSHMGLQEQQLLAAPLIIYETAKPLFDEQEHVVMIHDFTFRDPQEIMADLKKNGSSAMAGMTMGSDITYDAILANDRTLDDPEVVTVDGGSSLRLRLINAAAATNFWVDLGGLEGQLIAVDGNSIVAVKVKRFPLAIAQRADIRIVIPKGSNAWTIVFQSEGEALRGGIILQSGDAKIEKLSDQGTPGEALNLDLEAQLKSQAQISDEPATRRQTVLLTGSDGNYDWGFDGKSMMHDVLLRVVQGDRMELTMQNMTAMAHPMHLHGHYFKVVEINGKRIQGAVRDTILVPPGARVSVLFDADNPGTWAFHCHHLYHMNSGMMAALAYDGAA